MAILDDILRSLQMQAPAQMYVPPGSEGVTPAISVRGVGDYPFANAPSPQMPAASFAGTPIPLGALGVGGFGPAYDTGAPATFADRFPNDPLSGVTKPDDVPLPRSRTANVPLPTPRPDDVLPANAMPTGPGQLPAATDKGTQPSSTKSGGFDPISTVRNILQNSILFDPNYRSTMLAMAGGFAGAPTFGIGMSRAFNNAAQVMPSDRANEMKQTGIAATYRALVGRGFTPEQALAAVYNPDMLKEALKLPELKDVIADPYLGTKETIVYDPARRMATPVQMGPPANIARQPMSLQRQVAPDGTPGIDQITHRPVMRRGGKWHYTDDNSLVPGQSQ